MFALAPEAIAGDKLSSLRDLVLNPLREYPFDKLKSAILDTLLPSKEERLRKLLARHPMGDAKHQPAPSSPEVPRRTTRCPLGHRQGAMDRVITGSCPDHGNSSPGGHLARQGCSNCRLNYGPGQQRQAFARCHDVAPVYSATFRTAR
ncbi:unnamed protein product [Echinostoma caproni]|uniref:Long-chain-fatty-acid--CoA ligase n=1 Tax=Echinostoma caproni TaxID=27848 RepID=A0A183BGB1_9TREM|nr:unnamed protein product [Echinostoma caproni]